LPGFRVDAIFCNSIREEVMLDIEVSAAVAPGAKVAVYIAPNTDQGFIDAVTIAVHDAFNKPSVISISWGGPESSWSQQPLLVLDAACQSAAALGITITGAAAAGDNLMIDPRGNLNVSVFNGSPCFISVIVCLLVMPMKGLRLEPQAVCELGALCLQLIR
jgi:kumamolisin